MKTTIDFLEALKARYQLVSDYSIAKLLGVTRACVSSYRNNKSFFDDSTAIHAAKLLEIDPAYVVACVHSERAKSDDQKAVWREIMEKFGGVAASVVIGLAVTALPAPNACAEGHSVYYVKL
jgi:predicted transcriptional regulator